MSYNKGVSGESFQSPLGEVVKETFFAKEERLGKKVFQSPLGEVVKETPGTTQ